MSEIIYSESFGEIAERNKKICNNTRFDIASMTKILTGICFIKLVEEGKVRLVYQTLFVIFFRSLTIKSQ